MIADGRREADKRADAAIQQADVERQRADAEHKQEKRSTSGRIRTRAKTSPSVLDTHPRFHDTSVFIFVDLILARVLRQSVR